jgi:hypothetical protein
MNRNQSDDNRELALKEPLRMRIFDPRRNLRAVSNALKQSGGLRHALIRATD